GFVPVDHNLQAIPGLSLYGDGRLIVQGPVIEIYPGPAVPNLQVTRISEEGVQAILGAARRAGLMDGDASYDYPCIADAGTTRFTVTAEGRTSVVQAYALGLEGGDCGGVDVEARTGLAELQGRLGDLTWLPGGSMGKEEEFVPSEMRIFVRPYRGQPELAQEPVEWPLAPDPARFGEPIELEGVRCGVVSGDALGRLLPEARTANQLTPWTSDGREFALIFRPLLPDEHGC
ncbi:MAG TPA: hypothetical protein VE669_12395, partial [Actinomycetota bacterium]|nr:hypothetical protein [Actinomycetota bacterium]